MASQKKNSVLLKTSARSDVRYSGGTIFVDGLDPIKQSNVISFTQQNFRAEVSQVVTIGPSSSYTPTANTVYTVEIGNPLVRDHGYQMQLKKYKYTTPPVITTIGASAALQREYINLQLVAKINADATNYVVAASLLTGTGFTITDAAGYFPYNRQGAPNRLGANLVRVVTNTDGTGFVSADFALTTAAVYSVGVGADLANNVPVMDFMTGNLISGEFDTPLTYATNLPAVSGQKYNVFAISYLVDTALPTAFNGQARIYLIKHAQVWVDNGTGTDTANLAGYKALERQMHKGMFAAYAADPSTTIEWFDSPICFQDPLGAAPTGTADVLGWMLSPYGSLNATNIGTQTIVSPVLNDLGLLIDQDDTATEGRHVSASQQTIGAEQFIVGKQEATLVCRVVMGDWTDAAFKCGFRIKAVYQATFNNYTDIAAIGNGSSAAGTTWINGDLIVTNAGLNSAAHVQAISAVAPVDAVSILFVMKVALDGTVTAFADGVSFPIYSAGTTTMKFDAGDTIIPFYQHVNIGGGDPAAVISEFVAIPTTTVI